MVAYTIPTSSLGCSASFGTDVMKACTWNSRLAISLSFRRMFHTESVASVGAHTRANVSEQMAVRKNYTRKYKDEQ